MTSIKKKKQILSYPTVVSFESIDIYYINSVRDDNNPDVIQGRCLKRNNFYYLTTYLTQSK